MKENKIGRDYSFEPTIEDTTFDLRLDNGRINSATVAFAELKNGLGRFANPER